MAVKAANAAELSTRAAIALQMPIIRVSPAELGWGDATEGGNLRAYCYVHQISYTNVGATKAFPVEVRYGLTVGGQLPEMPNYEFVESLPLNLILDPAQSLTKRLSGMAAMETADWPLICSGKKDVWFYCLLVFEDFMRSTHQVGLCWRWQSSGLGMIWRADETEAYNQKT